MATSKLRRQMNFGGEAVKCEPFICREELTPGLLSLAFILLNTLHVWELDACKPQANAGGGPSRPDFLSESRVK